MACIRHQQAPLNVRTYEVFVLRVREQGNIILIASIAILLLPNVSPSVGTVAHRNDTITSTAKRIKFLGLLFYDRKG